LPERGLAHAFGTTPCAIVDAIGDFFEAMGDAVLEFLGEGPPGSPKTYVRYLGKPEQGLGAGLLGARKALGTAAKAEGASTLRIETSRVIEGSGRLAPILERAGFRVRPNGTMFWEGTPK
jgi:hypothetical protein